MPDDPFPREALFIKWGRFQAGAFGRLAILALLGIVAALIAGRAFGLW
jgi:hypothetical protein